jgi:hypothetical protein
MEQTNIQLDVEISAVEALRTAERLVASNATTEQVTFALQLKIACGLYEKPSASDVNKSNIHASVYIACAECLKIIGDLLAAQAVAERGLLHYPSDIQLLGQLAAIHGALAARYHEVAQRARAALNLQRPPEGGFDGQ